MDMTAAAAAAAADPDFEGEPLVFTEEGGRTRLERGLGQARAGQTKSLEEFNREIDALIPARVRG